MVRVLVYLIVCFLLSGCLSSGVGDIRPQDPYEKFNRKSFQFSESVDKKLLAPVAHGYSRILPDPLETGFNNLFANINSVPSSVNGLLQGQIEVGAREFVRLMINSTFGVAGFFDVASRWGLKQQHEDIGQTLAVWGLKDSPYVYIPVLGPSTVRDIPVRLVGMSVPRLLIGEDFPGYATALRVVGQRAAMSEVIEQRDANAIDPYTFTRDAYTQLRAFEIFNGDPPVEDFFDEFEDE